MSVCIWDILLTILFSRSIHFSPDVRLSFFLWLNSIPFCVCVCVYTYMYHVFFIHLCVDGTLELLSCLGYYKYCCCEHWNACIFWINVSFIHAVFTIVLQSSDNSDWLNWLLCWIIVYSCSLLLITPLPYLLFNSLFLFSLFCTKNTIVLFIHSVDIYNTSYIPGIELVTGNRRENKTWVSLCPYGTYSPGEADIHSRSI